jgi:N-acetylmuramoyl-L-alanine amidase
LTFSVDTEFFKTNLKMTRKLFSRTIFIAVLLLNAGTSHSAETLQLQRQLGLKIKTSYLDPWYGGREKGPHIGGKQYGKDITLKIAQDLQKLLESQGITVPLSRTGDQFVALEDRSFQAKRNGADIHLTIKVNQGKEDCIRIVILREEQKKSQPKSKALKTKDLNDLKSELDNILRNLQVESRYEDSLALAATVSKKLKDGQVADCVRLLKGFDYILTNAEMPAVIVDFGVSKTSKNPYVLDPSSMDKIIRSVSDAIKDYVAARTPSAQ